MVGSIGGFNPMAFMATTALNRSSSQGASQSSVPTKAANNSAADEFMTYMKKSPAERMEDNWLKAHGLTREKLASMSTKEQEAIMKQMKDDIERALHEQAGKKAQVVNILA